MPSSPYPAHRDHEVEWLGYLPVHWDVKRGRFCMSVNPRAERLRQLGPNDEVSFVPMEAVGEYGGLDLADSMAVGDASNYTEFQDGDVVVAKITPCFENGKGALAEDLLNGAAFGTTELHVLRAGSLVERRFLFYLTVSQSYRAAGEAGMYGASGQKRVPTEFNKDFRVPLPPLPEQQTIAGFLDAQTASIDTLVAKKRELIAKLREKRAALISRTVTRGLPPEAARAAGLDPHPRLKPSGIEWLRDVPDHWEIVQLRRLLRFITSGSRGWAEHYSDEGALFVRIGNLTRESIEIDLSDTQRVDPPDGAEGERTRIQTGDLLFSITAYLGSVAVAGPREEGGYINQHIALVRSDKHLLEPEFGAFVTLSNVGQDQLAGQGYGGTKIQLAFEDIKSLWIPLPPLSEQREIVRFLRRETAGITEVADKAKEAIERLQEYRTALITAAVTGKIDVRDAVATTEAEMPEAVA